MGCRYVKYKILKAFNNNVVLALQNNQEIIVVSKGIGFGKKAGDIIQVDPQAIEKVFHELNLKDALKYLEKLPEYNEEVIGVSEEIIARAETLLGPLSPSIHIALVDHIIFALDRIYMGLPIENPFIDEITLLYQEEYDVAELAASLIKERLGVDIGNDEKGFIALHLHSACNNTTIRETMRDTRIVKSIIELIIEETGKTLRNKKDAYQNFISSIKEILNYSRKHKAMYNLLTQEVKYKMKESYSIAEKISRLIQKEKNICLSEEMIAYIAIDIERICQF